MQFGVSHVVIVFYAALVFYVEYLTVTNVEERYDRGRAEVDRFGSAIL